MKHIKTMPLILALLWGFFLVSGVFGGETDEQIKDKEEAIKILEGYFKPGTKDADYSSKQIAKINEIKKTGKAKIDEAANGQAVTDALTKVQEEIDKIIPDTETVRNEAITKLEGYFKPGTKDADYSSKQIAEINTIKEKGKAEIEKAANGTVINDARTKAEKGIDKIDTIQEITEKKLQEILVAIKKSDDRLQEQICFIKVIGILIMAIIPALCIVLFIFSKKQFKYSLKELKEKLENLEKKDQQDARVLQNTVKNSSDRIEQSLGKMEAYIKNTNTVPKNKEQKVEDVKKILDKLDKIEYITSAQIFKDKFTIADTYHKYEKERDLLYNAIRCQYHEKIQESKEPDKIIRLLAQEFENTHKISESDAVETLEYLDYMLHKVDKQIDSFQKDEKKPNAEVYTSTGDTLSDFNRWAANHDSTLPSDFYYVSGDIRIRTTQTIIESASETKWISNRYRSDSKKYLFPNPNTFDQMTDISKLYKMDLAKLKAKGQNSIKVTKPCEIADNGYINYPGELELL